MVHINFGFAQNKKFTCDEILDVVIAGDSKSSVGLDEL
jgi:hypothetical protein